MNLGKINEKRTRFYQAKQTLCFTEKSQHRGVFAVRGLSQIHTEQLNTTYPVSFAGSPYKIGLTLQRNS
jgi:hypothetical protein